MTSPSPPTVGLILGLSAGFAGAFGGFGPFLIVVLLGLAGLAVGKVIDGTLDISALGIERTRGNRQDRFDR